MTSEPAVILGVREDLRGCCCENRGGPTRSQREPLLLFMFPTKMAATESAVAEILRFWSTSAACRVGGTPRDSDTCWFFRVTDAAGSQCDHWRALQRRRNDLRHVLRTTNVIPKVFLTLYLIVYITKQ